MNILALIRKKDIILISPAIGLGLMIAWFITNKLEGFARSNSALKNISITVEPKITSEVVVPLASKIPPAIPLTPVVSPAKSESAIAMVIPPAKAMGIRESVEMLLPSLHLSGVLISETGSFAIINGQVLGVGEEIRGGVVTEISKDAVVITFGEQKLTLSI